MRNEALVPGQPATSAPATAASIAGPPAPAPVAAPHAPARAQAATTRRRAQPARPSPAQPAASPARPGTGPPSPAQRRPPRPLAARPPRRPAPPDGLKPKGLAIWRAVLDAYDLDPDALVLLARVCKVSDRIAALDAVAAAAPVVITGSHGGKVVHPALVELRQQEALLTRMIRVLALPDLPGTAAPLAAVHPIASRSRRSHRAG